MSDHQLIIDLAMERARFTNRFNLLPERMLMNTATIAALGDVYGMSPVNWVGCRIMNMLVVIDDTLADGQFGFAVTP